jgi:TolB-like protein/Tfp pilus assembly protein PilF
MRDSASIAVLPLENLSGDPDQEFLADGMTEALIAQLAQISNLRVISRTSVMRYKNAGKPLPEIAKELRVDHIVEGSVAKGDGRVRVTAQLIDANEDRHLWAQTYDRELKDVLALQSEVAGAIAREVHIKLPRTNDPGAASHAAVNPQEFELCMRARQYSYEQTASGVSLAISTFQQALALDPNCPDAHAGLARTYGYLGVYGGVRPRDVMPKAKELALRAIALREATAEAHATLGAVYGFYDWDWDQAQRELVRALELEPGTAASHYAYAEYYLLPVNRLDEGVAELRRALDLDPMSSPIRSLLARSLTFRGDHDGAIKELGTAIERDPNFYWSHWALGMAYAEKKQLGAARAALEKAYGLDPKNPFNIGGLAYLDALSGNREAALKAIAEASGQAYLSPFWVAFVHAGLGDSDAAIRALQAGLQERDPLVAYAGVVPELKSLRSDRRFQDLLRRMNLAGASATQ